MNYKIYTSNYVECGIEKTEDEVDNDSVFKTFGEAKRKYLEILRSQRDQWRMEIDRAIGLTKKQIN
ncbi:hypothetical protein ACJRPK_13740 [Aquimarina sp. 2-A2]|uniref:hypothetical protein n=1 Tax=Aquimarina sp. 2-A2 TaxID=3382644 RepID=UPI00387EF425